MGIPVGSLIGPWETPMGKRVFQGNFPRENVWFIGYPIGFHDMDFFSWVVPWDDPWEYQTMWNTATHKVGSLVVLVGWCLSASASAGPLIEFQSFGSLSQPNNTEYNTSFSLGIPVPTRIRD